MNLQLTQNRSAVLPKKGSQRNQYVGPLHPQTKKRHGKGNYQYKNKFFEYDGQYVQGRKHGSGKLKLKDGTTIQATFIDDQITGPGKITSPDGSTYTGQLLFGQKNGHGIYQSLFERYQGQWKQNAKQGNGRLEILSRGEVQEGEFRGNKLHGKGTVRRFNYEYEGEWREGEKEGYGVEVSEWRRVVDDQNETNEGSKLAQNSDPYIKHRNYSSYMYSGTFHHNLFHGQGKYSSKISNYIYQGLFHNGLPTNYPNCFRVFVSSNTPKDQMGVVSETQKVLVGEGGVIEYELEGQARNIYVRFCCDICYRLRQCIRGLIIWMRSSLRKNRSSR